VSTAPSAPPRSSGLGMLAGRALAAMWLIGFAAYFFFQVLPNNSTAERPLTRVEFARNELPAYLLDCVLPSDEESAHSGLRYLPQRFDVFLIGLAVLVGAWCLGSLLLRAVSRSGQRFDNDCAGRFGAAGLLGLSAWSLITLGLGLCGVIGRTAVGSLLAVSIVTELVLRFRERTVPVSAPGIPLWRRRFFAGSLVGPACAFVLTPFVMSMVLGAMLPSTDFDVKAYHLVGPKEWFQQGRITYLPHNIYTSFPFLTEMLCLSTMSLRGDWYRGALAGQLVLASFAMFAAMMIFSSAKRIAGPRAGWLAAVVYLTTPWVCRISIIAYVEGGLAAYLIATLWAILPQPRVMEAGKQLPPATGRILLCGLFAGSAAACKYPGVISAVIPFGVVIALLARRDSFAAWLRLPAVYGIGVLAAFGPWLLKNLVQTGNPVYPLLWGVFGGGEFDSALAARFKAGHPLPVDVLTTPARWLPDLWAHLRDVAVGSDWQSVLVFGLLPASLLAWFASASTDGQSPTDANSRRRGLLLTSLFTLWLFLTWWGLTHRLDRFWVPMLSVLSVLGGIGADRLLGVGRSLASTALALMVLAVGSAGVVFNLGFDVSPYVGFTQFLMDQTTARRVAEPKSIKLLNELPADSKTLLVGEAQVFECRRDVIYNTVFNRCLFEEWFAAPPNADGERLLRAPDEIREELARRDVTHVFVNWLEVLRYRTTYGYSEFVTPERLQQLVDDGILDRVDLPDGLVGQDVGTLQQDRQSDLKNWGKSLIIRDRSGVWFPAYELFTVRKE
jgi:hypothetical protein